MLLISNRKLKKKIFFHLRKLNIYKIINRKSNFLNDTVLKIYLIKAFQLLPASLFLIYYVNFI